MSAASLYAWIATVLVGLLLLVIWLLEYDPKFQGKAATRLPIPVLSAHALLGMAGLLMWGIYLLADVDRLVWPIIADLGAAVLLGLIMVGRWIRVYRTATPHPSPGASPGAKPAVPAERHFPLSAVILHGTLAVTTIVLVLWIALFES